MPVLDLDAARREGLTPVRCPRDKLILALEEPDGKSVRVNGNTTIHPVRGRVALRCVCGYVKDWRPDENGRKSGPT